MHDSDTLHPHEERAGGGGRGRGLSDFITLSVVRAYSDSLALGSAEKEEKKGRRRQWKILTHGVGCDITCAASEAGRRRHSEKLCWVFVKEMPAWLCV